MLRNTHRNASALVTTLFVLVVLCTITVAFLQTMTMERAVSRSLKNKFKADLAAEAGANMLAQAMTEAIGSHAGFLVLSTVNLCGYYYCLYIDKTRSQANHTALTKFFGVSNISTVMKDFQPKKMRATA